jgi:beta-galactosidase
MVDVVRGHSGNFIVPEQQSGLGSRTGFATPVAEEGEMQRMAMSSIARGADGILFFRWRPAHFGAEMYWNGILDHDDVPRRRFEEAKRMGTAIKRIGAEILGTSVRVEIGIAGSDFDNQEAHKTYPLALPDPQAASFVLHGYCFSKGIPCGFVHPEDDLSRLKVFFVPHWVIWNDAWTARLEEFARAGGTVIIGARTGSRDANNHVIRDTAPGKSLSALCGVKVEEFGLLPPPGGFGLAEKIEGAVVFPNHPAESSRRAYVLRIGDVTMRAAHCYELLSVQGGAEVVGRWDARFVADLPAITSRAVGKGRVVYVGTYITADLAHALLTSVIPDAGFKPLLGILPQGVEVSLREGDGRRLLFIQNATAEEVKVEDVPKGHELMKHIAHAGGTLALGAYGCAVIRLG